LKPKTRRDYTRILRTLFPEWETKPTREITKRDVKEAIDRVMRTHGGCPANRAFACLRKMMNWALNEVIIEAAPTTGLQRPAIEEHASGRCTSASCIVCGKRSANRPCSIPYSSYGSYRRSDAKRSPACRGQS
jgi:hypothetical protein